jgi:hypothetical protein
MNTRDPGFGLKGEHCDQVWVVRLCHASGPVAGIDRVKFSYLAGRKYLLRSVRRGQDQKELCSHLPKCMLRFMPTLPIDGGSSTCYAR